MMPENKSPPEEKASVEGYLARVPTKKLEAFIQQCQEGDQKESYEYIYPFLQAILQQRKAEEGMPIEKRG